jgi:hypothetical protein
MPKNALLVAILDVTAGALYTAFRSRFLGRLPELLVSDGLAAARRGASSSKKARLVDVTCPRPRA